MDLTLPRIFVSHASEDKKPFVDELAKALSSKFRVWYDEYSIPPGGSIFQSVSVGLGGCDFGIVVLSKSFFGKKWTQAEIGGLFVRESPTIRRIIPVWKDVTLEDVTRFSPILADRRAVLASEGIPAVVNFVSRAIETATQPDGFVHTGTVVNRFSGLGQKLQVANVAQMLAHSTAGVQRVVQAQRTLFRILSEQGARISAEAPQLGLEVKAGEHRCLPNDIMFVIVSGPGRLVLHIEFALPNGEWVGGARCDIGIYRRSRDRFDPDSNAEQLEEKSFTPVFGASGEVFWEDRSGVTYGDQQLCDLAFQRLAVHIETTFGSSR